MNKLNDRVEIRIEADLKKAAKNEAEARGTDLASLIRAYLKRITGYGKKKEPTA